MSYLTSVKTINGETSGFYQYPIKYVATSAEATENSTLYVLTGESYGAVVPTLFFKTDPYNPLNLPANTVRVRTDDGKVPFKASSIYKATYDTATLVPGTTNVYDVYKSGTSFYRLFLNSANVVEVLGANTTGITNMKQMFNGCNLTSVALFDTSSVTDMSGMFGSNSSLTTVPLFDTSSVTVANEMMSYCTSLTYVPLFDTSSITNMNLMFSHCTNVVSGALALYQQASTQTTPPSNHDYTFTDCGRDTQTGAAELDQIPINWK